MIWQIPRYELVHVYIGGGYSFMYMCSTSYMDNEVDIWLLTLGAHAQ